MELALRLIQGDAHQWSEQTCLLLVQHTSSEGREVIVYRGPVSKDPSQHSCFKAVEETH